jgi:hypothetical protein
VSESRWQRLCYEVRCWNLLWHHWVILMAIPVVGGAITFGIIRGGTLMEADRKACRDRGLVPVTHGGFTECARGER